MRLPCVIEVDLRTSRRGLASRLAEDLAGESVLARTIEGVRAATRVAPPVLLAEKRDESEVRRLAGAAAPDLFLHELPDVACRPRLRRARLWGSEGWRGGFERTLFVSEAGNPAALSALFCARGWQAALVVPAEAAFVDPALLDQVAEGYLRDAEQRLYLSTAPPGLAGDVFHREVIQHLHARGAGAERLLPLRIDDAAPNYEDHGLFHPFDERVMDLRGRFTVDSHTSLERARALWPAVFPAGAAAARAGAAARLRSALLCAPEIAAGVYPEEIIVELGADRGGAHPARGRRAPHAGLDARAADAEILGDDAFAAIAASFGARDEALLTLGGGRHDPLLDAALWRRIALARNAGVFGVHVDTCGAAIDAAAAEKLAIAGVDAITVDLGVPAGAGRGTVPAGTPPYEARKRGLEELLAAAERAPDAPFVALVLAFDESAAPHWEAAYEEYFARVSRIVLRSPEGARGERLPQTFGIFTPPRRRPCVRLGAQMRVEHDGRVPLCNRDPEPDVYCGDLRQGGVAAIWQGERFRAARAAHAAGAWSQFGHCGACNSWCRLD